MAFEAWMVNRDESPAVEFEGTFTDAYVLAEVETYVAEGFLPQPFGTDAVRIVFVTHPDGRPWIYREFYAVGDAE